jgi:hypothetical protein
MSIEEKYELFDAYLEGNLNQKDLISFEALMLDADSKKEFEEYKNIQQAFINIEKNKPQENAFIDNLKKIGNQYNIENAEQHIDANNTNTIIPETKTPTTKPLSFTRNIKLAIASMVILAIGLWLYNTIATPKQDMQSLFTSNYTVDDLSLERGSANDSLENITALYNAKKYAEALPIIKIYSQTHADNGNMKIALATCYFTANDYVNTESTLQNLIAQNDAYKEKAQWYLAMCYIKQEKKQDAIALLSSFDKEHFYADKAKRIVKELQRD